MGDWARDGLPRGHIDNRDARVHPAFAIIRVQDEGSRRRGGHEASGVSQGERLLPGAHPGPSRDDPRSLAALSPRPTYPDPGSPYPDPGSPYVEPDPWADA